jgi:hypothetical protein
MVCAAGVSTDTCSRDASPFTTACSTRCESPSSEHTSSTLSASLDSEDEAQFIEKPPDIVMGLPTLTLLLEELLLLLLLLLLLVVEDGTGWWRDTA